MTIAARHQACRYTSTARSATEHRSGETSTELAARLLAEAPQRDWRLRDLAALVHLSVSQLGRAFTHNDSGCRPCGTWLTFGPIGWLTFWSRLIFQSASP